MPNQQLPAARTTTLSQPPTAPQPATRSRNSRGQLQPYQPSALGISARPTPRQAKGELARAPEYGDLDPSDLVHDEIKDIGREVRHTISQHLPRHGTSTPQVLAGIRQFGPSKQSKKILNKENEAARLALSTGVYCVWRCMEKPKLSGGMNDFCCRIGYRHRCFCGHTLANHSTPNQGRSSPGPCPCEAAGCVCRGFQYVPNEPEEIGEGWLTRRANYDPQAWSAKCRCGHGHLDHDPGQGKTCHRCGCRRFQSHFLCVVCDQPWEVHVTVFETESARQKAGLPTGAEYFPLANVDWDVRELVLKDPTCGGALQPPASYQYLKDHPGEVKHVTKVAEVRGEDTINSPVRERKVAIKDTSTDRTSLPSITQSGSDQGRGAMAGGSGVEYCRHCATIFRETSKFCRKCGQPKR